MTTRLEHALALARQGFRIFPLRAGSKVPFDRVSWKAIMSSDEDRIRQWFDTLPDMNYAVVCDPYHVILDPDEGSAKDGRKKDGVANFKKAEQDSSEDFVDESAFDTTFRVRTPKGGVHLYFLSEGAYSNSVGTIIPDVDVRGPDGYVVGPGSYTFADYPHTEEGEYVIENDVDPAALPGWLKTKLDIGGHIGERAKNAGTAAMALDSDAAIEAGKRVLRDRRVAQEGMGGDNHTYVTAALVKDYGVSREKCLELMFSEVLFEPDAEHPQGRSWNEMCDPPWDFDALETKVGNAYKFGNRQIGAKMDALSAIGNEDIMGGNAAAATMENLKTGEHFSAIPQPIGKDEDQEKIRALIGTSHDFVDMNFEVESLIPGWIPAFGVTAMLARRGTGKTVAINDLAHCIATDAPWNGVPVAQDWSVIYLCGEDDIGLQRQMKAWRINHNSRPAPDRFLVAPAVPNLMDAHQVQMWAEELKVRFKDRRVLVVLDTWQRATSTASQNDDKEMQKAIHHAESLARYLNGCALIAFHPPKGNEETITGSAVLENSTVAILHINTVAGGKRLAVKRIKGRGEGNYFTFNIMEVPVGGIEKDGKPITGVIPKYNGGNTRGPTQEKLNAIEAMRRDVLALFYPTLSRREGKGVSTADVAAIVVAHCDTNPESEIAKFFDHPTDADEVLPILNQIYNPSVHMVAEDGTEVVLADKKFKMG